MLEKVVKIRGKKVVKEKMNFGAYQSGWFFVGNVEAEKIILFLHGGPGSPEFSIFDNELLDGFLDERYAVCYLDFLGSGLSFTTKKITENLLIEQVETVATYLKEKYQIDQIILIGHSYGSYIGMKVLQVGQVEFSAYYGISQVVDVRLSEEVLYRKFYQLAAAEQNGNMLKQLVEMKEKSNFPSQDYIVKVKSRLVERYHGGVFFNPKVKFNFLKRLCFFKGYTLSEKINYLRGLVHSSQLLFPDLLKTNLYEGPLTFNLPIFFIHGEKDLQVSKEVAVNFFDRIISKEKQLVIVPDVAHSPHIEKKEVFLKLI